MHRHERLAGLTQFYVRRRYYRARPNTAPVGVKMASPKGINRLGGALTMFQVAPGGIAESLQLAARAVEEAREGQAAS